MSMDSASEQPQPAGASPPSSEDTSELELPPCEVEHLDDIVMALKASLHPMLRGSLLWHLTTEDGAYIVKLLDMFDLCELGEDPATLHKFFDIFYALVEMCDRRVVEILLNDNNFLSVVGVFEHNPGLIRRIDFRTALEGNQGFKEVIPIEDESVLARVHMNFRIHVIKDNVLSRTLPDCSVLMLEHITNENNFHILTYVSKTESYWQTIKELVRQREKRRDGLGLLKELIQLVRVTKPLDKQPQPRRDLMIAPPLFGALIDHLFDDGSLFEAFGTVFGSEDSQLEEVSLALDILNTLVFSQGPERVRTYLASEGKCISPPTSESDRIVWKQGSSSLFAALLLVFEKYEQTRIQMFTLLREIFRIPLGQDDKFLSVLYPNYIHWLLQPLKRATVEDEPVLFALQGSVMELLTFCTETHGYRVKYLFGRQPIASYADKMLRSKNKLFVIHAVKFVRACVARSEAFFSRFLVQNELFAPIFATLRVGDRNDSVVASAVLELLAFVEKAKTTALIEHIHTKFYEKYKDVCPPLFDSIRLRYEESFGTTENSTTPNARIDPSASFVRMDDDEEQYWEKDTEPPDSFVPAVAKDELREDEVGGRMASLPKLVDYDDDDEPTSVLKEGDVPGASREAADEPVEDLKLPVREKKDDEVDTKSFLAGGMNGRPLVTQQKVKAFTKARQSPQYKNMFQKISWKRDSTSESEAASEQNTNDSGRSKSPSSADSSEDRASVRTTRDECEDASTLPNKRKLELEQKAADAILKKSKPCTPISSN